MRVLPAVLALLALAGCRDSKPAVPEDRAVLDSYEAILFLPDPDLNSLMLRAAYLGPDAIPPILRTWPSAATNEVKRIKLARMLEVLAWNGFHTPDSVKTLSSLTKDRQIQVRKSAVSALFASGSTLEGMDTWWDPGDATPGRTWNPVNALKLPCANCRELLARQGVPIEKNSDGSLKGDPGRTHAAQHPIPQAHAVLRKWWSGEPEAALKLYSAILALRTGDTASAAVLVGAVKPPPEGSRVPQAQELARVCALRALQEFAHQNWTSWEEWSAWWETVRPKPSKPLGTQPPR